MKHFGRSPRLPHPAETLPGRAVPMDVPAAHAVHRRPLAPPFGPGLERAVFGLGCFWGAERAFWTLDGVHTTAVGYAGGATPNPTYEEVCTGLTGHAEVVLVVYRPEIVPLARLLQTFWESHDPTQGLRQGNDVGTQYRSVIYLDGDEALELARSSAAAYGEALRAAGLGPVTTEIRAAPPFYYAEAYHQQYLAKNPGGYCGHGGTGVSCPVGALARGSRG
jgi:peptide-methionine (S)-S-oxide reductase